MKLYSIFIALWIIAAHPFSAFGQSLTTNTGLGCGSSAGPFNFGEKVRTTTSLSGEWFLHKSHKDHPHKPDHKAVVKVKVPGIVQSFSPSTPQGEGKYLWYTKTFSFQKGNNQKAFVCINKARFGVKVWVNGRGIGEHLGPYTLGEFDATEALGHKQNHQILIRIGNDPSMLPPTIPAVQDQESREFFPGIYDDITVVSTGPLSILRQKIEPDIHNHKVTVFTTIRNHTNQAYKNLHLSANVKKWSGSRDSGAPLSDKGKSSFSISSQSTIRLRHTYTMDNYDLWRPETPNLYVLHTTIEKEGKGIDDRAIRFGMREFTWKSGSNKGFYLNHDSLPTYLRGTNIALHRFFEDQDMGNLPWDHAWVRRLLGTYPKDLQWNSMRFAIGRAPNFWYHLADEIGLLIDDEFQMWTGASDPYKNADKWSVDDMTTEFTSWVQENWNHASIAWWSTSNETDHPKADAVLSRVRPLDPTRLWENGGYIKGSMANEPGAPDLPPVRPEDPVEAHPYKMSPFSNYWNKDNTARRNGFDFKEWQDWYDIRKLDYENATYKGNSKTYKRGHHPYVINEYGWLWVTREGQPTLLSEYPFAYIFKNHKAPKAEDYREASAYLWAGLTNFWRVHRNFAGVQHFVYLTGYNKNYVCTDASEFLCSIPGSYLDGKDRNNVGKIRTFTSDPFVDIENLEIEPRWFRYAQKVWSPVSVYIDSWRQNYERGANHFIPLMMINDTHETQAATLRVYTVAAGGGAHYASYTERVNLEPGGEATITASIPIPGGEKPFVIYAALVPDDSQQKPAWSTRKVGFPHYGAEIPLPEANPEWNLVKFELP